MAEDENIVKKVCKDLGLTYKQLGEAIAINHHSDRKSVSLKGYTNGK